MCTFFFLFLTRLPSRTYCKIYKIENIGKIGQTGVYSLAKRVIYYGSSIFQIRLFRQNWTFWIYDSPTPVSHYQNMTHIFRPLLRWKFLKKDHFEDPNFILPKKVGFGNGAKTPTFWVFQKRSISTKFAIGMSFYSISQKSDFSGDQFKIRCKKIRNPKNLAERYPKPIFPFWRYFENGQNRFLGLWLSGSWETFSFWNVGSWYFGPEIACLLGLQSKWVDLVNFRVLNTLFWSLPVLTPLPKNWPGPKIPKNVQKQGTCQNGPKSPKSINTSL